MRCVLAAVLAAVPAIAGAQTGIRAVAGSIGSSMGPLAQCTHSPLSMVTETKTVQTLADGTHLTNVRHRVLYRDSQGRVRNEQEVDWFGAPVGPRSSFVTVMDPVAQMYFHWQTGGEEHEYISSSIAAPAARNSGLTARGPVKIVSAEQTARNIAMSRRMGGEMKTEALGAKTVAGVACDATRVTTTYAVETFGNDRPIVVTDEQCRSRELGELLEEVRDDPRTGVQTTTVTSLSRVEPDAGLFQPPPGYTVRMQPQQ